MTEPVHVTEVLDWIGSKELAHWRGKVGNKKANRVRQEALAIGTKLHAYIASRLTKKEAVLPELPFGLKMACVAASKWLDLNKVEYCVVEKPITTYPGLVATPDLLATVNGKPTVVDWKTSRYFDWKHVWQINTYLGLTRIGLSTRSGLLVRLDKQVGVLEELAVEFSEERWHAFFQLMDAYLQWRKDVCPIANSEISTE